VILDQMMVAFFFSLLCNPFEDGDFIVGELSGNLTPVVAASLVGIAFAMLFNCNPKPDGLEPSKGKFPQPLPTSWYFRVAYSDCSNYYISHENLHRLEKNVNSREDNLLQLFILRQRSGRLVICPADYATRNVLVSSYGTKTF